MLATHLIIEAWPTSRDFLKHSSLCCKKLDEANAVIMGGIDGVQRQTQSGGGGGGFSSPVESEVIWRMDGAQRAIERAEAIRDECTDVIGAALVLCEGVRVGLGEFGDMLELHYIDRLSIVETAEEMDVSPATVKRHISVACDWCDSIGARAVVNCAVSGVYDGITVDMS